MSEKEKLGSWKASDMVFAGTVAVLFQNVGVLPSMLYGAAHGVGFESFALTFSPMLGCAAIWITYAHLGPSPGRKTKRRFGLLILAVLALNEAVLPETPLRAWFLRPLQLGAVRFEGIEDAPLRTAAGNLVGSQIVLKVRFPVPGKYFVSVGQLVDASSRRFYPTFSSEDILESFEAWKPYTLTFDLLPTFLAREGRDRVLCFTKDSEAQLLAVSMAVVPPSARGVLLSVSVGAGDHYSHTLKSLEAKRYDWLGFRDGAIREGATQCSRD